MDKRSRAVKKSSIENVSKEFVAVPAVTADSMVTVLDTSRHASFAFLIKNNTANGVTYTIQGCNLKEDLTETGWIDIVAATAIAGSASAAIIKNAVSDKTRLLIKRTAAVDSTVDVLARLNPLPVIA